MCCGPVLGWIQEHAHTRMRRHGDVMCVDAQGIVVGVFRQHTSRRLDPQLHTHAVIANRVTTSDGRWLALDARTIKLDQRTLSALYHAGLRAELTRRLGVLPREDGYGIVPRTKNGPPLAGYGAVAMKNALMSTMTTLPDQLRRSLTSDRGKELSQHVQFKIETGIPVYFADPQSPWQRGTNENTNGLLRQYFPKGTDLSRWNADELQAVAHTLDTRPRKTLDWRTPAEALDELLRSLGQAGVATTG